MWRYYLNRQTDRWDPRNWPADLQIVENYYNQRSHTKLRDPETGMLLSPLRWFHKFYSPRKREIRKNDKLKQYIIVEEEIDMEEETYLKLTSSSNLPLIVADALDNSFARSKRQSAKFESVKNYKLATGDKVSNTCILRTFNHQPTSHWLSIALSNSGSTLNRTVDCCIANAATLSGASSSFTYIQMIKSNYLLVLRYSICHKLEGHQLID